MATKRNEQSGSTTPPTRMSAAIRTDCIEPLVSIARSLEDNPNKVVNDCLADCLKEMQRPISESAQVPAVIRRYRDRINAVAASSDDVDSPMLSATAALLGDLLAARESLKKGKKIDVAVEDAVSAYLTTRSRLLSQMADELARERKSRP